MNLDSLINSKTLQSQELDEKRNRRNLALQADKARANSLLLKLVSGDISTLSVHVQSTSKSVLI